MRKEFTMTETQLNRLIESSKPVPYMIFGEVEPTSPQKNANMAWARLGDELGFDSMTVRPVQGKTSKYFTAEEETNA